MYPDKYRILISAIKFKTRCVAPVKQHPNYNDNSPCLHTCNANYWHATPINHDRNDL